MLKRIILTGLIALIHVISYAQESKELLKNLKPIVQVFGTATYDLENYNYGYSFGRTHLGFQYHFNKKWSSKIIIDLGRATSVEEIIVTDADGKILTLQNTSKEGAYYTMYLKFASLQWRVNEKLTLEGGAILQNHYITQERFWGLRYVAQTFQDLYWKIPSSDLGFIAYYIFNDVFSLDAAITNGEGPRVKQDASGKVKFAGGINMNPSKQIQSRLFFHNRQSRLDNTASEQMFSAFIGYKPTGRFRVGGEFNYMNNLDNMNGLNSYGFSFYTTHNITDNTELFARYDRLQYEIPQNMNTNAIGNGNTIISGISYTPVKGVALSLNYQGWLADEKVNAQNSVLISMEYKF